MQKSPFEQGFGVMPPPFAHAQQNSMLTNCPSTCFASPDGAFVDFRSRDGPGVVKLGVAHGSSPDLEHFVAVIWAVIFITFVSSSFFLLIWRWIPLRRRREILRALGMGEFLDDMHHPKRDKKNVKKSHEKIQSCTINKLMDILNEMDVLMQKRKKLGVQRIANETLYCTAKALRIGNTTASRRDTGYSYDMLLNFLRSCTEFRPCFWPGGNVPEEFVLRQTKSTFGGTESKMDNSVPKDANNQSEERQRTPNSITRRGKRVKAKEDARAKSQGRFKTRSDSNESSDSKETTKQPEPVTEVKNAKETLETESENGVSKLRELKRTLQRGQDPTVHTSPSIEPRSLEFVQIPDFDDTKSQESDDSSSSSDNDLPRNRGNSLDTSMEELFPEDQFDDDDGFDDDDAATRETYFKLMGNLEQFQNFENSLKAF